MDIDLKKVIGYSRDSLQSRALMRSIILDLYPGKTREMKVLLDVYESGVPKKIKDDGHITEAQYIQYVQKIIDEYGLQEQYVINALDQWIDVCLYPGASVLIQKRRVSNDTSSKGTYTQPIIHNQVSGIINPVVGKQSNYDVKDLSDGTVEISKFVGFDQADTIIPTEIDGKKVVGIGVDAFKQCKGIQQLIIPEGIEYISQGAFAECSNLKKVVFPISLKEIGKTEKKTGYVSIFAISGAFQGTAISEIDMPNDVTVIGEKSFADCKNLAKIQFPDNLKIIKGRAFSGCDSLREITLSGEVLRLENGAFSFCKNLSKVKLNEGLKTIENDVFNYDPELTYLVIPKSVINFGKDIVGAGGYSKKPITLGCYPGSKAIEYARSNNLQIVDASR